MRKFEVVTHYSKEDKSCSEDYFEIEIKEKNKKIISWGDHYHDKGKAKAKGFISGLEYALGKNNISVTYIDLADIDE